MKTYRKPSLHGECRFLRDPRVRAELLFSKDVSREMLVSRTTLALDRTGLRIWEWLKEPCSVRQLSSNLQHALGWDAERARHRIISLLKTLMAFGKISAIRTSKPKIVSVNIQKRQASMVGYTLIEILVVLAVIAVLAGLLTPVAARTRKRARMIECTGNLMEVGKAYSNCLTDSNGYFPEAYYSYTKGMNQYEVDLRDVPASSPEKLLLAEYRDLLLCPSDNEPAQIPDSGSNPDAFSASYAYNLGLPILFKNSSRVREPVNTVSFYDGDPNLLIGPWVHYIGWAQNSVQSRHIDQANYLFLDGHVEQHGDFPAMAFEGNGQLLEPPYGVWTVSIEGSININPNNTSTHNDFLLYTSSGVVLSMDDITNDTSYTETGFGSPGLFYEGKASKIMGKPKALGLFKDSLFVNGESYTLPVSDQFCIESTDMTVRLYNTKRNKQGKAVGKWIIELETDEATLTFN